MNRSTSWCGLDISLIGLAAFSRKEKNQRKRGLLIGFEESLERLDEAISICHKTFPETTLPSHVIEFTFNDGRLFRLFYDDNTSILCIKKGNNWHKVMQ